MQKRDVKGLGMDIRGKKLHFMGAGGIGVSALAGIALARGAAVSGCDREENAQTRLLRELGAEVQIGHSPEHVRGMDLVVYTSAVPLTHPELAAAEGRIMRRGDFLAELISRSRGIGICGTHGKTTTTWITANLLIECGLDPTVLVGGAVDRLGGNFRAGGALFVSELDESDGSFLKPTLDIAVITNIESEHLAYYQTMDKVVESFRQYSEKTDAPRLLVANLDCPVAAEIYQARQREKIGFGLRNQSGYHVRDLSVTTERQQGRLMCGANDLGAFSLRLPGRHNVSNALAALAVAVELGVPVKRALEVLAECPGVGRRMEYLGRHNGALVYTDYAHHPTEVQAAISGAREMCAGRLLVVFQPHLFSRTRDYYEEFGQVLAQADGVVLAEIYPAREEPIPGVTSELIAQEVRKYGTAIHGPVALEKAGALTSEVADGYAMVIFMGAGDIEQVARKYARAKGVGA